MNKRFLLGLAPLAAVAFVSLAALPSCSNELAGCDSIFVLTIPQGSLSLFVGDSSRVYAAANSSCLDRIGHAVDFSSTDPAILGVRQVDDTTAVVRALSAGLGGAKATARDRNKIYTTIPVFVTNR